MEGAEGLFDGRDGEDEGSTGQIAKWLGAPVVLVLDCGAIRARSAAAVLKGYLAFDPELSIAGVVLNKIKDEAHTKVIRDSMEAGPYAPRARDCARTVYRGTRTQPPRPSPWPGHSFPDCWLIV